MDPHQPTDLPPPPSVLARRSPYRLPPHLDLDLYAEEEIIEAEILAELIHSDGQPDTLPHFDVVDGKRLALESSEGIVQEDPTNDVPGPEAEKPAGVRVQWKRPTELFADAGAKCTARGIDFIAATHQRIFDRLRNDDGLSEGGEARTRLVPMNPFETEDPFTLEQRRRTEPAPFETLARES